MFRTASGQRGTLDQLIAKVGVRLELPEGDAPYLVPGEPIIGTYDSGTEFKVTKAAIFTNTSKMPGVSFAIPAGPPAFGGTCPASALGEDAARARRAYEQDKVDAPARIEAARARKAKSDAKKLLPVLGDSAPVGKLAAGVQPSYAGDKTFTCRSCYALDGNYRYPSKQLNDMMHLAWCEYELAQGGSRAARARTGVRDPARQPDAQGRLPAVLSDPRCR
jgi:hypothetical protein